MILILGIGSPYGDDRLGWKVVEQLQHSKQLRSFKRNQLNFQCLDRPGLNLLKFMEKAQTVYIIDAVKMGRKAGKLYRLDKNAIAAQDGFFSSHNIGVGEAIALAEALNELPPYLVFYGIELETLETSSLSPAVAKGVKKLVKQIEHELTGQNYALFK